jgi:hypothetical protein
MTDIQKKGINSLTAFDEKTKELNVIIETPKSYRNKYKFDEEKPIKNSASKPENGQILAESKESLRLPAARRICLWRKN